LSSALLSLDHAVPLSRQVCINAGTHYLDLAADFDTLEALKGLDALAKQEQVTVMGGVGWGCVATDLLAFYLAQKVPEPVTVDLAIKTDSGGLTPGALAQLRIENQKKKSFFVVRNGATVKDKPYSTPLDFGAAGGGQMKVYRVRTGELWSAFESTGIGNITTSVAGDTAEASSTGRPAMRSATSPPKPGSASVVHGTVYGADGSEHTAQLFGPEVATFTSRVVVGIIKRLLRKGGPAGRPPSQAVSFEQNPALGPAGVGIGYRTPSQAFGLQLLEMAQARIVDVPMKGEPVGDLTSAARPGRRRGAPGAWEGLPDDDFCHVISVSEGWRGSHSLAVGDHVVLEITMPPLDTPVEEKSPWGSQAAKKKEGTVEVTEVVAKLGILILEAYMRSSQDHEDYDITKHHARVKAPGNPDGEVLQAEVTVVRVDNSEDQRDYVILKTDMIRGNDGQVIITIESEIVLESATLGNGASFPLHLYGIGDAGGARPL